MPVHFHHTKSKGKIDETTGSAASGCRAEERVAELGVHGVLPALFTTGGSIDVDLKELGGGTDKACPV